MGPTVTINQVEEIDALYCKYPGQYEPQPVELSLDTRTGVLSCGYDPNIGGGTTFDHLNRLILSVQIPALTAESANWLMAEVLPLAQQVLDGADQDWDGNNTIGVFTDAATSAWDEIVEMCSEDQLGNVRSVFAWDVADWFTDGDEVNIETLGITAHTTDQELADLAAAEVVNAASTSPEGYGLLDADATMGYLEDLRAGLRDTVREQLEDLAARRAALRHESDELIRTIKSWNDKADTLRSIGALAGGISHTEVGRILKKSTQHRIGEIPQDGDLSLQYEYAGPDSAWVIREYGNQNWDIVESNGELSDEQLDEAKSWAADRLARHTGVTVTSWKTAGPGSLDQTFFVPIQTPAL